MNDCSYDWGHRERDEEKKEDKEEKKSERKELKREEKKEIAEISKVQERGETSPASRSLSNTEMNALISEVNSLVAENDLLALLRIPYLLLAGKLGTVLKVEIPVITKTTTST